MICREASDWRARAERLRRFAFLLETNAKVALAVLTEPKLRWHYERKLHRAERAYVYARDCDRRANLAESEADMTAMARSVGVLS